jgi:hypothetical protein
VPVQDAVVNPDVAPYVPAGQLMHDEEPAVEYVPAAQVAVHVAFDKPVVAPYVPAVQLVHKEEPAVE